MRTVNGTRQNLYMKQISLCLILLSLFTAAHAQTINSPAINRQDSYNVTIDRVEITYNNTIIYCTHTAPSGITNGGWVRMSPDVVLKATYLPRRYKLIRAEGIPLSPEKFYYSYSGQKLNYRLIFPRIADDISYIDLIEDADNSNAFNFYGIKIRNLSSPQTATGYDRPGRQFLRDQIKEWGECKNVAMTLTGGDVALYKRNGWAASKAPDDMTDKLKELHDDDKLIDDIVLTEDGSWLILWGTNGISSYGAPDDLFSKLKKWNNEGEVVLSVTFNDKGEWIAITNKKYSASSESILDFIKDGNEKYGQLWAAHMTNDGLVLCYEKGYKFLGNVPDNLRNKLNETRINVYRIKFLSDGTYFIADKEGRYAYNM